jgi:hypothetical protein
MIRVGDTVTWRSGKSANKGIAPIGIANCRVVELSETATGQPAAIIKLPAAMIQGIGRVDMVSALIADLEND